MGNLKDSKGVLMVAIVVILGLFLYNSFAAPVVDTPEVNTVGQDLIQIANSLSQASLNRGLFTQSGYRLLSDFSVPLIPEPLGRLNPFAAIGK